MWPLDGHQLTNGARFAHVETPATGPICPCRRSAGLGRAHSIRYNLNCTCLLKVGPLCAAQKPSETNYRKPPSPLDAQRQPARPAGNQCGPLRRSHHSNGSSNFPLEHRQKFGKNFKRILAPLEVGPKIAWLRFALAHNQHCSSSSSPKLKRLKLKLRGGQRVAR